MQTTGLVSSIPTRIGTGRDRTPPPFADRSRPWIMPLHPTIAAFTRRRPDRGEARHTGADTLRGDGSAVAGHRVAHRRSPGPSPRCRPTSSSPCWLEPDSRPIEPGIIDRSPPFPTAAITRAGRGIRPGRGLTKSTGPAPSARAGLENRCRCCALRSDRPKRRTVGLRASVGSTDASEKSLRRSMQFYTLVTLDS